MKRHYSLVDRILGCAQDALFTLYAEPSSQRPSPAESVDPTNASILPEHTKRSVGLMRINHTGEVCAQALYRGQALCARDQGVLDFLAEAEHEEQDHLAWCHQRLLDLDAKRSVLNLYWYTHSFLLGWLAGRIGDSWSLGFVEETEKQVGRHLDGHLQQLGDSDAVSRAIIEQMATDEAEHANQAKDLGAKALPSWVKGLMRCQSKVMTTLVYWL